MPELIGWLRNVNLLSLVGLAGVDPDENRLARLWGRGFNYAVVVVAILLLLQWQAELLDQLTASYRMVINCAVWLYFLLELLLLLLVVNRKARFLQQNWLLPIIILLGLPLLLQHYAAVVVLRPLRPVLALVVLAPSVRLLGRFFVDGQLRTTLMAAGIIIVIFGVLMAGVDPNVSSVWDGIWWAIATVSTVGYGDIVPASPLGRLIGVGLIILGLGIFVTITANFLAIIVRKEVGEASSQEAELSIILASFKESKEHLLGISELLATLDQRLEKLEKTMQKQLDS